MTKIIVVPSDVFPDVRASRTSEPRAEAWEEVTGWRLATGADHLCAHWVLGNTCPGEWPEDENPANRCLPHHGIYDHGCAVVDDRGRRCLFGQPHWFHSDKARDLDDFCAHWGFEWSIGDVASFWFPTRTVPIVIRADAS